MSEMPISPLRRCMIEDMTIRNFSADTQRNYIRAIKNLAIFWVDRLEYRERMEIVLDEK
jgi:hypothetical protein